VLIVLDNVSAEDQVRPLLPGAGNSLVLITSRGVLAGLEVDQRIDLGVLPEDEATELLATLIGRDRAAAEPEAVRQIRHWCGSLPLALRISGQLLAAHPNWPVSRLAAMLADERARLVTTNACFGCSACTRARTSTRPPRPASPTSTSRRRRRRWTCWLMRTW
jgi:non-ribosomal peptide synthetase component F